MTIEQRWRLVALRKLTQGQDWHWLMPQTQARLTAELAQLERVALGGIAD